MYFVCNCDTVGTWGRRAQNHGLHPVRESQARLQPQHETLHVRTGCGSDHAGSLFPRAPFLPPQGRSEVRQIRAARKAEQQSEQRRQNYFPSTSFVTPQGVSRNGVHPTQGMFVSHAYDSSCKWLH